MGWWQSERVPEPEAMDEAAEVDAYASAAAQAYLDQVDNTFVAHVVRLQVDRGRALDIGTGPGQIPLKLARRLPMMEFIGIDRSQAMLEEARRQAEAQGLGQRVRFEPGNANRLDFADDSFDLVLCNSVLHHLAEPVRALDEIARVARRDAAVLVRDLRRPGRLAFPLHVRWYGRHYTGRMRELYEASVRSSYTVAELGGLLARSRLSGVRVFRFGRTHIGLERPAGR